ncbi:MAG: response regulator [Candidatus Hydrogenedens sp.]|nr:response regulator [Candidatus Hydrogenedens sp.]
MAMANLVSLALERAARRKAEQERESLASQLLQSQKLEAIGRLAGGVAHDFNNMLTVILGNAEYVLGTFDADDDRHESMVQLMRAGQRSADLTRQLLAFARRQAVEPRVLDINDSISHTLKMLGRLLGEDIRLVWKPGADAGKVLIDPAQIDQMLANLTINARDAIRGIGTIVLETGSATLDKDSLPNEDDLVAGCYTVISVSDTGCGMDAATQQRIFEPFFTTKAQGEGTGLGLATVYGIVSQNNGYIKVYSEPGHGAIFKIYLPTQADGTPQASAPSGESTTLRGSETVLLVEDERSLMELAQRMLERLGYTVLPASSADEALVLATSYDGRIDLLLTDVIMPEMNGRDVWIKVAEKRPGIRCLFMSGYTAEVIAHQGVLEEGVHFLQKPFTLKGLAAKVREALGDSETA